jgi:ABC-type transport system substrate-binding protein
MDRRDFLKAGAIAALAGISRPALAQSADQRTLRFVPYTDLTILDPMWSTVDITRDYGYMVYDTLYGLDGAFQPVPQLAEGHLWENDGRSCTITLRSGISFHDGEPIRARDCVASLKRWAQAAPMGATLMAFTDELSAVDDRKLRFRLKRPFPMLPAVLGQLSAPAPLIMPERVASTDAKTQITDHTGSGPFRFKKDEFKLGDITVFEKFEGYKPTPHMAIGPTGGWSLSCWLFPGAWFINPGTNIMLRGNGRDAWFGWPTIPKLEELRNAWLEAPTLDEQKRIARDMQVVGMDELPAIPLGAIYKQTALHKSLVDRVKTATMFWNIRRA